MSRDLKPWALFYARLGWTIFPLVPGTKSPFKDSHGSKEATSDLAQVEAWWTAYPEANIGVRPSGCGEGLYVFDVDPRNNGHLTVPKLEAEHGPIESPLKVLSPGGGWHLYFKAPRGSRYDGAPGEGVDGKYNGYAVLPPSLHPNGKRYSWANGNPKEVEAAAVPQWLVKSRIEARPAAERPAGSLEDLPKIKEALSRLTTEEHYKGDNWRAVGAALKDWGQSIEGAEDLAFELWDEWSQADPTPDQYDPDKMEARWGYFTSDRADKVTIGTLFHMAGMTSQQWLLDKAAIFGQASLQQVEEIWTDKPVEGFYLTPTAASVIEGMRGKLKAAWDSADMAALCSELAGETGGNCALMLQILKAHPAGLGDREDAESEIIKARAQRATFRGVSNVDIEKLKTIVKELPHHAWPFDSDQFQAGLFAQSYSDRFKHSPGRGWFTWHPQLGKWIADDGKDARLMLATQIFASFPEDVTATKRAQMGGGARLKSILDVARDKAAFHVDADAWDTVPYILNTPHAAYDLRTGETVEREGLLVTQSTAYSPDFDMPTPLWDATIQAMCPNWDFLERVLGYTLTAERIEQLLFVLHGEGANAKSTLAELHRECMGDYATGLSSKVLVRGRHAEDVKEIGKLMGKRLALAEELGQGSRWDDDGVKNLVSAGRVTIKKMHKDAFEAMALQKVLVVTNVLPALDGADYAMRRRLALIEFPHTIRPEDRDTRFAEKLREEAPGVLAKLIRRAAQWYREGLPIPESVSGATDNYVQDNDEVQDWLDSRCEIDAEAKVSFEDLYSSFALFVEASRRTPMSKQALGQSLRRKGFETWRTMNSRGWSGLRLAPPSKPQ